MHTTQRAGVLLAAAALVFGSTLLAAESAAAATPVDVEINGITYEADADDVPGGAIATEYDRLGSSDTSLVTIPDEVTISGVDYDVVAVDDTVFRNDSVNKDVVIGDNVTDIGDLAFFNSNVDNLTLGSSVVMIGESAFQRNWLQDLVVPDAVETIGEDAFHGNDLGTLALGSSVVTVGAGAFGAGGTSPFNHLATLTVPDSVTTIGQGAFSANKLASLTLGSSVETIEPSAFGGNELTELDVPDSVVTIGSRAFERNRDMTHVTLGSSVQTIGARAFGQIDALVAVEFTGEAPTVISRFNSMHTFESSATGPVLIYPWRFGDPQTAGGYTSPEWFDYDTQAIATVDFDLNGHGTSVPDDQEIAVSEEAAAPNPEPSESGYQFTGWFTGAGGDVEFDFGTAIAGDTTVYAGWEPLETSGGGDGDSSGGDTGSDAADPVTTDDEPSLTDDESDQLLPDTGGAPVGVLALGAMALVAGSGILVRRRSA